jgi:hypothetical protein
MMHQIKKFDKAGELQPDRRLGSFDRADFEWGFNCFLAVLSRD